MHASSENLLRARHRGIVQLVWGEIGLHRFSNAHDDDCHSLMASIGTTSMMMFRVRLSRIQKPTTTSIAMASDTTSQTGAIRASENPSTIARMSEKEFTTLSP